MNIMFKKREKKDNNDDDGQRDTDRNWEDEGSGEGRRGEWWEWGYLQELTIKKKDKRN